jgi:hypothetical protein
VRGFAVEDVFECWQAVAQARSAGIASFAPVPDSGHPAPAFVTARPALSLLPATAFDT